MFWARFEVKQIEFLFKQRSKTISMSLTTKLETGLNSTSAAEKKRPVVVIVSVFKVKSWSKLRTEKIFEQTERKFGDKHI